MSTNTEFTKVEKFPVGNTGNALTSLSDDHIIGTAGDIYDTEFHDGAYQNEINKYLDNKFTELGNYYLPLTGGEINGQLTVKEVENIEKGERSGITFEYEEDYPTTKLKGYTKIDRSGVSVKHENIEDSVKTSENYAYLSSNEFGVSSESYNTDTEDINRTAQVTFDTYSGDNGEPALSILEQKNDGDNAHEDLAQLTSKRIKLLSLDNNENNYDNYVIDIQTEDTARITVSNEMPNETHITELDYDGFASTVLLNDEQNPTGKRYHAVFVGNMEIDLQDSNSGDSHLTADRWELQDTDGNTCTELTQGGLMLSGTDSYVELAESGDDYYMYSVHYPNASYIERSDNENLNTLYLQSDEIKLEHHDLATNEGYSSGMTAEGLMHPLTVLYRDANNNPVEFEYKAGKPVEGDSNAEEPGNNLNTIDLSRGVYYATTSKTATKVSNELTLKQGDSVIYYNGQLKETFDVTPLKEITYNELKTLRDNNELLPGQQYRITDYVTTTNGDGGTNSAGNAFNIIVKAKTSNELSENAKAIKPKFTNLYTVFNDYNPNNINTITAKYYVNNNITAANWTGVELNKIPNGILNLPDLGFVPSTDTDIRSIKLASGGSYDLNLSAGKYWVLINYISGNNRLNTVGAELVAKGTDTVISSDYHIGYTGHQYSNRLYCLEVPSSGIYNIKCYIIAHKNYDNGQVNAEVNIQAGSFNNNINNIIPFINNNLSAWELKYSIENTSNIVNWVKSDGKGHIYYMKDEFGNECNYDFKNIRYGNYYTFDYEIDGKHIDGSSVYGNLCYNNVISMDVSGANGKLGFAEIYFKNTTNSAQCHSNKILHDNWQIIFGNNCYDNYIGEKSQFITIGNNCHHNIIKCNSQHITLNNDCYSNTIDIGCETINFGESCHHNIIKCSSKSITLNTACHSNTIGIGCETINFGDRCRNNILNDGCLRNTFESQCIANTMDNDCNDNTFDSQCCDNKLGRLSNNNSFGEGSSNNILGNNCTYNKFGTNCSLNTLGNNCIHNKFGVDGANCSLNTLGNNCEYNEFISNCSENIFGEYCSLNKFGSQCNKNIFELRCHSNVFGNNCYSNIFNINCYSNNFGANCFYNRFGIDCKNNLLTSNCHSNTFGNYCWDNKFGNGVFANTFGIDCSNIQIITAENSTNLLQFVRNFKFGNYCNKLKIYPKVSVTTADIAAGYLQNFEFGNNLQNVNIALEGTAGNLLGRKYITKIDKNSSGTIIQKCLMDANISENYNNGKLTISII